MYRSLTQETYWGKDFQLEEFKNGLKHSLVFGVYLESGEQIGFCRVITDYMTLAYIKSSNLSLTLEFQTWLGEDRF